jgi:hypothetical protein
MKIKTVVFWILWVGNDLTSQTIREQNPDPASPPFFPSRLDDADLVSQALGLTAPQKEQVQQLAEARRPQLETVRRQARDEEAAILKQRSDQVRPQNSTADYADNTDTGSGGFNRFGIGKSGTLIVFPVLSAEQRTKLDALQNVVGGTHNDFGMVRTGINFAF